MCFRRAFSRAAVCALVVAWGVSASAQDLQIRVLSGRPDMVSGGDALVQISGFRSGEGQNLSVWAGDREVTHGFHKGPMENTLLGKIDGLTPGKTSLSVRRKGKIQARLDVTNYPIMGPIFSLKPVDVKDYAVPFSAEQMSRLKVIFPEGVCDYSRPGIEEQPTQGNWRSY